MIAHLLKTGVKTVFKKISHKQIGGQIVKAHNVCVFLCSLIVLAHVTGIVSVDTMVLKHLFFVNSTWIYHLIDPYCVTTRRLTIPYSEINLTKREEIEHGFGQV